MPKLTSRSLAAGLALFLSFTGTRSVNADATAYYVYDSASAEVGLVTVTASGNSSQQYLSADGTYTYTLPSAVTSVTVNGVTILAGQQSEVALASGALVRVHCDVNGTEILDEGRA